MSTGLSLSPDIIKCTLAFTLDDGSTFTLESIDDINNINENINVDNRVTSIKLNEDLSATTDIPVGVINSSVLDITLISKDRKLVPNNSSSAYFGHLNNKAKIHVVISVGSDPAIDTLMGDFYVDEWKSNTSSSTANQVVISATGLMSKVAKLDIPSTNIDNISNFKDYIIELFDTLNTQLSASGLNTVVISSNNIDFTEFPNMQYANLKMDDIGTLLNDISQSTLTNIYIDRNDYLRTDFCCDDQFDEVTLTIDVMTNAQVGDDFGSNYDGVSVKYSRYNIKDIETLASITNTQLVAGDNKFDNVDLGEGIYKINRIVTNTQDINVLAYTKSAVFNKKKIDLIINSDGSSPANISVLGRRVDSTELTYDTGGKNKLLIENKVLDYNYIEKYTQYMLQLINIKDNSMTVTCYITPDLIKLGDTVYINCAQAMSVSGDYKVVGISWEFSTYSKATLRLIKTFEITYDIDSILYSQNTAFTRALGGYTIDANLDLISERENTYIEQNLSSQLSALRAILGEEV